MSKHAKYVLCQYYMSNNGPLDNIIIYLMLIAFYISSVFRKCELCCEIQCEKLINWDKKSNTNNIYGSDIKKY